MRGDGGEVGRDGVGDGVGSDVAGAAERAARATQTCRMTDASRRLDPAATHASANTAGGTANAPLSNAPPGKRPRRSAVRTTPPTPPA